MKTTMHWSGRLERLAVTALGWMVTALLWALALLNLLRTAFFQLEDPYIAWETVFYKADPVWPALLFTGALVLVVTLWKRSGIGARIPAPRRWIAVAAALAALGGVVWMQVSGQVQRHDSEMLIQAAQHWMEGDFSDFAEGGYLFCFPYQLGYALFLEGLFRLFGAGNVEAVRVVNSLCIGACVWLLSVLADKLMPKDSKNGTLTACLLLGAWCAVLFTGFAYGNVPGMTLAMAALYLQVTWQQGGHWGRMLASGVCIAFGVWLKSFSLIFLIAQVILLVLQAVRGRSWKPLAAVLAVLLLWQGLDKGSTAWMERRIGHEMNEGAPMILTLAMGMQNPWVGWRAEGWNNGYNLDIYSQVGYDAEEASALAREAIGWRLEEYRQDPATCLRFYYKKACSQWAEPTYQSLWINCRIGGMNEQESRLYQGKPARFLESGMELYQSAVWLSAAVYVTARRKKLDAPALAPGLVILGGFLFQMLWEGKSQYILPYFLLAVPYASAGLGLMAGWVQKLLKNPRNA